MLEIKIKQMSNGWLLEVKKGHDSVAKIIEIDEKSFLKRKLIRPKFFLDYIAKILPEFDSYLLEQTKDEPVAAGEKLC